MPLLEAQSKIGFSRETYKLPTDVKSELQQYCRFANSDADHVVVKALQYVFAKDKDFSAWKKTSAALPVVEETSQRKVGRPKTNPPWNSAA